MCLAHIYAMAGAAQIAFSADVHDYGVDGTFRVIRQRGRNRVPSGIPLDYQAKATVDWKFDGDEVVYDLNARAYNNIVERAPEETTLILILLCLPPEFEKWHETTAENTTLRNCCYWWVGSGELTENSGSRTIRIPRSNLLRPSILLNLLEQERKRRRGQVT
jgi:Domain of unknown function (DUF4365)